MPIPPDDKARHLLQENDDDPLDANNPQDIDDIMTISDCSREEAQDILRRFGSTREKLIDEKRDEQEGSS